MVSIVKTINSTGNLADLELGPAANSYQESLSREKLLLPNLLLPCDYEGLQELRRRTEQSHRLPVHDRNCCFQHRNVGIEKFWTEEAPGAGSPAPRVGPGAFLTQLKQLEQESPFLGQQPARLHFQATVTAAICP